MYNFMTLCLFNVAYGALDDVNDGGTENSEISFVGVEALEQEHGQFVRNYPEGSRFVHFEIVWELQRLAVRRH